MYLIQCLDAGHTPSGNPKRIYVVYNKDGGVVQAYDEGYVGIRAVPEALFAQGYTMLPTIKVPHQEYRFWTKRSKAIQERA